MQEEKVASSVEFTNELFSTAAQIDDTSSLSYKWGTRELDIRKKIFTMTESQMNIFYIS